MNIQKMLNDYLNWLKSEISATKFGEYYEITAPFLDNSNDYLQFYIKQEDDRIFFTDDAVTISNSKMQGVQFTRSRNAHLEQILCQYGIQRQGDELVADAPLAEFPQKKHLFIQAMLRIDDMFALTRSRVTNMFVDDIRDYFSRNEIYCSENVLFAGKSGFTHTYDFLIQRTKTQPERLCQAVNSASTSAMKNILFSWIDTKATRRPDSQLILFLNDQNPISDSAMEGFANYNANTIVWSRRNEPQSLALLRIS